MTDYISDKAIRVVRAALLNGMTIEDKFNIAERSGLPIEEIEAAIDFCKGRKIAGQNKAGAS